MPVPAAVLLDVGGVFLLPDHERILGAFGPSVHTAPAEILDDAHYHGAARLTVALDAEGDWAGCWRQYLEGYVDACTVPDDVRDAVHARLDREFADAALWFREAPGHATAYARWPTPVCASASCRTPTAGSASGC